MIKIKKIKTLLLLILIWTCPIHAEASFKKDSLLFRQGNGWIPTQNSSTQAIQFTGNALVLEDNTIIDSPNKDLTHYIAPMIGAIMAFSVSNTANIPASWLICDGREVKKTDYPLLYSAIRDNWGAAVDPARFKLPDLRNYFLRGLDDFGTGAANLDTNIRQNNTFTATNTNQVKIGSYQTGAAGSHSHTFSFPDNIFESTPINPNSATTLLHGHSITNLYNWEQRHMEDPDDGMSFGIYESYTATPPTQRIFGYTSTNPVGNHTHTYTFTETGTGFAGSPDQLMLPKRILLVYCIKYEPI